NIVVVPSRWSNLQPVNKPATEGLTPSMILLRTARRAIPVLLTLLLLSCGGSGQPDSQLAGNLETGANPPGALPPIILPDVSLPALPLPTSIGNGAVVELACGRVYRGTLDLRGK